MNAEATRNCVDAQRYISADGMRATKRKRAILEVLEAHGELSYGEYGPPPYTATTITRRVGGSVQSVARTLRGMATSGLLVAVRDRQEVWNAIASSPIASTVTAYYSARTMVRDIAAAKVWKDGANARSRLAEQALMAAFGATSGSAQLQTACECPVRKLRAAL